MRKRPTGFATAALMTLAQVRVRRTRGDGRSSLPPDWCLMIAVVVTLLLASLTAFLATRTDGGADVPPARAYFATQFSVDEEKDFGLANTEIMGDPLGTFDRMLRVRYPKGSASPTVAREEGVPIGGAQLYLRPKGAPPADRLRLRFSVRFDEDFDFVKGGKLPGLFGGSAGSGGEIPDGRNGFSTRLMWRAKGDGEVYAYLPTSSKQGTSIGRGQWRFLPGQWHRVEQEVVLNRPGESDGRIRVWLDQQLVLDRGGLLFRTAGELRIDGIFFSTFFGGGDRSWSTPRSTYADFADFALEPAASP